jgi:hypothetical protein
MSLSLGYVAFGATMLLALPSLASEAPKVKVSIVFESL